LRDVIKDAIEEGRRSFPKRTGRTTIATTVHSIPTESSILRFRFRTEFDVILAYSVFTHTTLEEMHDCCAIGREARAGGTLAFTFIDPHWQDNLRWRLERSSRGIEECCERVATRAGVRW
jgi:hypothetical protein